MPQISVNHIHNIELDHAHRSLPKQSLYTYKNVLLKLKEKVTFTKVTMVFFVNYQRIKVKVSDHAVYERTFS